MSLENLINKSNQFYYENNIAVINKKPTPIKVAKVDSNKHITSAYFESCSTVDYSGIYNGYHLEFEAKSTTSKTSLSFYNFEEHQLHFFEKVIKQNGICFVIIEFSALDRWFLLLIETFLNYLNINNTKSMPIEEIEKSGFEIFISFNPLLDYLKAIKGILI